MTTKKGECVDTYGDMAPTHRTLDRPQKRGAKGYYTGSRLAFLESRLDEYISLRGKSRHHFWYELYEAWWEKFPWRLPDKEEPPTDDNAKMKQLAYLGVDDANEKAKVEAQTHEVSFA